MASTVGEVGWIETEFEFEQYWKEVGVGYRWVCGMGCLGQEFGGCSWRCDYYSLRSDDLAWLVTF